MKANVKFTYYLMADVWIQTRIDRRYPRAKPQNPNFYSVNDNCVTDIQGPPPFKIQKGHDSPAAVFKLGNIVFDQLLLIKNFF